MSVEESQDEETREATRKGSNTKKGQRRQDTKEEQLLYLKMHLDRMHHILVSFPCRVFSLLLCVLYYFLVLLGTHLKSLLIHDLTWILKGEKEEEKEEERQDK